MLANWINTCNINQSLVLVRSFTNFLSHKSVFRAVTRDKPTQRYIVFNLILFTGEFERGGDIGQSSGEC